MKYRPTDTHHLPRQGEAEALDALPRPVYGHMESLANRVIAHRHRHLWIQLSYATQGVIEVQTPTGLFYATPRQAVWIAAGTPHKTRCAPSTEIRSLYIEPAGMAREAVRGACCVLEVGPLLRELIRAFGLLPAEYREDGAGGRLAAVLMDQLAAAPQAGLVLPLPADPGLRRVCLAMQAHPGRPADLEHWAAELGVSGKTLSRMFVRQTGLSFRLWRQRLRLLAALPALERGQRVTDAALDCGYESVSAFIAAFRGQFGRTPGDYFGTAV